MNKIKSISLQNIKNFQQQLDIKLDGKNLLIYGENGTGKTTISSALNILFRSSYAKNDEEITRYFVNDSKSIDCFVNIHTIKSNPMLTNYDSYIGVITDDDTPSEYKISGTDLVIKGNIEAQKTFRASDFLNYRLLMKLSSLRNSNEIDLQEIFIEDIFPYVFFTSTDLIFNDKKFTFSNPIEIWDFIKSNLTEFGAKKKSMTKGQISGMNFNINILKGLLGSFNENLKELISYININGKTYLKQLGYSFTFILKLAKDAEITEENASFQLGPFSLILSVDSYEGLKDLDLHPQSFLNEAKLSAIAIALRFAVLSKKLHTDCLKFLVIDDLLISLDMCNREKVLDLIIKEFVPKYQTFIMTHDMNFFKLVEHYISKHSNIEEWKKFELYQVEDTATGKFDPILIDDDSDHLAKANKYYRIGEYTVSALYLRKQLEKHIIERLPKEYQVSLDRKFNDLSYLWERCIERYSALKRPIDENTKNSFSNSKLLLLNPQAHHTLSAPVYSEELKRAFQLVKSIEINYPIIESIVLLSEGMVLRFQHPTENYSFDFKLKSDYFFDRFNGKLNIYYPKCKVLEWQHNGVEFFEFKTGQRMTQTQIERVQAREDRMDKVIENLEVVSQLNINRIMFSENTRIMNGIWKLNEILNKAGVTL